MTLGVPPAATPAAPPRGHLIDSSSPCDATMFRVSRAQLTVNLITGPGAIDAVPGLGDEERPRPVDQADQSLSQRPSQAVGVGRVPHAERRRPRPLIAVPPRTRTVGEDDGISTTRRTREREGHAAEADVARIDDAGIHQGASHPATNEAAVLLWDLTLKGEELERVLDPPRGCRSAPTSTDGARLVAGTSMHACAVCPHALGSPRGRPPGRPSSRRHLRSPGRSQQRVPRWR